MLERSILLFLSVLGLTGNAFQIDARRHDIVEITAPAYNKVIGKFRDHQISALVFFKDDTSESHLELFNDLAKELKNMIKVAAINCDSWDDFCSERNVQQYPSVMIIPRNPLSPFLFEKELTKKNLQSQLLKFLPTEFVKPLTSSTLDAFLTTDMNIPKVVLLSDKKSVAPMFKALSNQFRKDMHFGFASAFEEQKADTDKISKRIKCKKYPCLALVEGVKQNIEVFKGEMKYMEISEWVNLKRETFASGGGFDEGAKASSSSSQPKPWLVQEIPEVTKQSHQDVCFGKGEGLCVILLREGAIEEKDVDMMRSLKTKYTSHLDGRGANFRWMWMDLAVEKDFKQLFGVSSVPSVVVFNPHKRLRFTKNDSDGASEKDVQSLLEKIMGGDARFKIVKGQKLPAFATRQVREEL